MSRLRLALLGRFDGRVLPSDRPLAGLRKKARALLAFLACAPRQRQPRDVLLPLLWDALAERQARNAFRVTLSTLQSVLRRSGVRCLHVDDDGIRLDADVVDVDVLRFERCLDEGDAGALRAALALYEGEFLAGLTIDSESFEQWVRTERQRLHAKALVASERLLGHQLSIGDDGGALETALRSLALDPFQDPVHGEVMRIHVRAGRTGAALRHYEGYVELLSRELGTSPDVGIRALYQEILRRPVAPGPIPHSASALPASSLADRGVPVVGRAAEQRRLRAIISAAERGRGRMLVMTGEAGVGKTRLVTDTIVEATRRGHRVMAGRAFASEQLVSLGPWLDALRRSGLLEDEPTIGALPPQWRGELTRLLPELGAPPPIVPGLDHQRLVFEAILQVIRSVAARTPVLIALEDLHGADDATVRLLGFIARRVDGTRVAMLATAREEDIEPRAPLRGLIAEFAAADASAVMRLGPLSQRHSGRLVDELSRRRGSVPTGKGFRAAVWRAAAGNPFVIVETVRGLRDDPEAASSPPASVRAAIAARLERLVPIEERLVAAAAVIGRDSDFALLQQAAGLDAHEAAEAMEGAVRRRILTAADTGLDFVHDRIRDVAYQRLTETRRRLLHDSVARALAERRDDASVAALSTIAEHYARAHRWEEQVRWHRASADAAMARGQLREALSGFGRAIEGLAHLPDSPTRAATTVDIHLVARHARQRLGDMVGVLRDMEECERLVAALNDRHRLGWVRMYQASAHWVSGRSEHAYALAGEAAGLAEAFHDRPLAVAAIMHLGGIETQLGRVRAGHDRLAGVLASLEERHGHPRFSYAALPGALARCYVCLAQAELGAFSDAIRQGRRGVEIAEEVNDGYSMLQARSGLVIGLLLQGATGDARAALEPALDLCRQRGLEFFPAPLTGMLGYLEAHDGRAAEGVRLLRKACEDGEDGQAAYFLSFGYAWLAEAQLLAGRVARARETAVRAVALVRRRREATREAWALRVQAEITARVDARRAEAEFHQARELAGTLGLRPVVAHCHAGLSRVYRRLAKHDAAMEHERLAAAMFADMAMPLTVGLGPRRSSEGG